MDTLNTDSALETADEAPVVETVSTDVEAGKETGAPAGETKDDAHPLEPGGKRFNEVWARAKKAEALATKERDARIAAEARLDERRKVTPDKPTGEKVYSWDRRVIAFEVRGIPQPKGSTKAFMRPWMRFPIVTADNTKSKPWQDSVRALAQTHAPATIWAGAIRLEATFHLPRPKSLPKATMEHIKKPDLDKLLRCLKDSLKGVIYLDDAQVIAVTTRKCYSDTPGVSVRVQQHDDWPTAGGK